MATLRTVHIIGGGTVSPVRCHLDLAATSYGTTARKIAQLCDEQQQKMEIKLHLTRMADPTGSKIETPQDLEALVLEIIRDRTAKIVFFSPAIVDFSGTVGNVESGKYATRLHSREKSLYEPLVMDIHPQPKMIPWFRQENPTGVLRKDLTLVGFKTTCGASLEEQYREGLHLVKGASANLVLANDTLTRMNMVITPEEARYHETTDRDEALRGLVEMAYLRSNLTFTQSTVVAGELVPWASDLVPSSLRAVVNHCIGKDAYKPFRGVTAGHFAVKIDERTFLSSIRKSDFNKLDEVGLVRVQTDGPDTVVAYGAKPSVGGQSQRIVFRNHEGLDCIVHFHCPIRPDSKVPIVSQREFECGSHECGANTSNGLTRFGNLWAVHLDNHGPNIVFNRDVEPREVIDFIEANFDLAEKTGGYVAS